MPQIQALNEELLHRADIDSFNGNRGKLSKQDYTHYCNQVLAWPISDEKKQKLLDRIYSKWSEILRHEASHVSVMVAGPANYNSKKLDHGDKILELRAAFCEWFEELQDQIVSGSVNDQDAEEVKHLIELIEFCTTRDELRPDAELVQLANKDNSKFIEYFERLYPKYKWRKNCNLYKIYAASKGGKFKETKREVFFKDENLTAYTLGDRAYIKFAMRPARQMIVALKSRKWWWNSYEGAWSTYISKLDKDWVQNITEHYEKYL